MEFYVAKDLVFALREVGLQTEALQGTHYKGLTPVTDVPRREALAECELFGETYEHAKETPGQARDLKVEGHLLFIKLQCL